MIDTHLHVVDFLQKPLAATDLSALIAESKLDGCVVFGLPVKKKWATSEPERPTYYLDDNAPCGGYSLTDELVASLVAGLDDAQRASFAPLICGFDPTDQLAVDHVEHMIRRHDIWHGVGEVLLRHDDLTELTYGENARAGHPALNGVLDICESRGWSFVFHQDASSAGRSGQREYVGEVTRMLQRHSRVPHIWAHAGVSRRVRPDHLAAMLGELLADHPNLHVDLSWVLFDAVVFNGLPHPDWVRLMERHPDRFTLGSDMFGDLTGHRTSLERWGQLTSALSPRARHLVEVGNARRLWW